MKRFHRTGRSGFIFVQTLIVVMGLVALMVMLASQQRQSMAVIQQRLDQRRAEMAADAAVARALGSIQQANRNQVTRNDNWALLGNGGDETFDFGSGATFRIEIVDTAGAININTAGQQQLQGIPLTQEQIDSLLDWRETATQPRSDGAKDSYYNALPQPYNAKLGPLSSVDELLLVRAWTPATLYQPATNVSGSLPLPTDAQGTVLPLASLFTVDSGSPNTQASGSTRVNFATGVTANRLRQLGLPLSLLNTPPPAPRRPPTRAVYRNFRTLLRVRGLTQTNVQQLLNVAGFGNGTRLAGKVNVNTAPQAVLQTIPNMTTTMASSIVARQSSGFAGLGDLATMGGLTTGQIAQVADALATGSDTWTVRAYGESNGVGAGMEAVVGLRNARAQVIRCERLRATGIPNWWDWNAQASATEDPGATQ